MSDLSELRITVRDQLEQVMDCQANFEQFGFLVDPHLFERMESHYERSLALLRELRMLLNRSDREDFIEDIRELVGLMDGETELEMQLIPQVLGDVVGKLRRTRVGMECATQVNEAVEQLCGVLRVDAAPYLI